MHTHTCLHQHRCRKEACNIYVQSAWFHSVNAHPRWKHEEITKLQEQDDGMCMYVYYMYIYIYVCTQILDVLMQWWKCVAKHEKTCSHTSASSACSCVKLSAPWWPWLIWCGMSLTYVGACMMLSVIIFCGCLISFGMENQPYCEVDVVVKEIMPAYGLRCSWCAHTNHAALTRI